MLRASFPSASFSPLPFLRWLFVFIFASTLATLAYVAGVKGEGAGEQERRRRGTGARDEGTPATKTNKGDFCLIG